ncbi:MAG: sulfotransferase [Acidimicrobiia bacterium]|nr:sulfotransferase [Acidimicrobiia bacterium]
MVDEEAPGLWRRTPRPWHGMTPAVWWRLLARHRFRISPGRWPLALTVTLVTAANAVPALLQRARRGEQIARTEIDPPPLFIIGHWRSGTTLLHELLSLDPQFRCPTTYQCMAPGHFLLTERALARRLGFLLPEHRPLDDMRLGWELPQEDEFALANLGALSPYHAWAFPRSSGDWEATLDPRSFPPAEREHWQQALLAFLQAVTLAGPGRLALKSPPHTARLGLLAEMFPRACFVHTVRHPLAMVPSYLTAWRRMAAAVGLQTGERPDLDGALLRLGAGLYRGFAADRRSLDPARMVEIRYEDLAADPAAQLARIYHHFGFPNTPDLAGLVAAYRARVGPYRPARHRPSPALCAAITPLWAEYAARYDYALGVPPA